MCTSAQEILEMEPDGVMLTNGPGDPTDVPEAIEMIKEIQGKIPIFGICLGHQLFSLANGAKTYKRLKKLGSVCDALLQLSRH